MHQHKIKLVWNLGADTRTITHPKEIVSGDPKLDNSWFYINVKRTLNIAQLSIYANGEKLESAKIESASSSINATRLTFNPTNRYWVGGVPDDRRPKELLAANGLNVILHELAIDQRNIGLWNFASSETCAGSISGIEAETAASDGRYFTGEGYAVVNNKKRPSTKKRFNLNLSIKTRDEDALLFLVVDQTNNRSISLTLSGGKIIFTVDYGNNIKLEIGTPDHLKYNTGNTVTIDASKMFESGNDKGSLKVADGEVIYGSPTSPVTNISLLPDISNSSYYFGGIPPGFKSNTTKAPGADHAFLGCMKDIIVDSVNYDPLDSSTYFGVEATCKSFITK